MLIVQDFMPILTSLPSEREAVAVAALSLPNHWIQSIRQGLEHLHLAKARKSLRSAQTAGIMQTSAVAVAQHHLVILPT